MRRSSAIRTPLSVLGTKKGSERETLFTSGLVAAIPELLEKGMSIAMTKANARSERYGTSRCTCLAFLPLFCSLAIPFTSARLIFYMFKLITLLVFRALHRSAKANKAAPSRFAGFSAIFKYSPDSRILSMEKEVWELKTKKGTFTGIMLPSQGDSVVLKLKSGYNISIKDSDVLSKKRVSSLGHAKEKKKTQAKKAKALPVIHIIHLGGTIASRVDYETGGVSAQYEPSQLLALYPELSGLANIESTFLGNILSENLTFAHYNLLAESVLKAATSGAAGVIVTHGTDTMHYTSAALSFVFPNSPVPIVFVGAQRSSDRPSSDAYINLLCAAFAIAKTDLGGVSVCMHDSTNDSSCVLLPGTKTRKMHTSRRDAFRAVNAEPYLRITYPDMKAESLSDYPKRNPMAKMPRPKPFKEGLKLGFLKAHPNMSKQEVEAFRGFDGVVLEGTGLGHAPILATDEQSKGNREIRSALKELCKEAVVAVAPQTIFGRINLNVYSAGRELLKLGVVGNNCDMTPETAFIKLAFLLSNYPKEQARELFEKNIAGELSERSVFSG